MGGQGREKGCDYNLKKQKKIDFFFFKEAINKHLSFPEELVHNPLTCLHNPSWPPQFMLNLSQPRIWASFASCVPDVAGSPDTWDKMEKEILDDISQETQDDYGQDYIHTKKSFLQIMKTRSCPDLTPVLWDIQHAISAKNPSSFYTPGKLTYQWICLSSYFPTSVLDYVVHKCFSSRYKPRALRTSS